MQAVGFSTIDWVIFGGYFALLAFTSVLISRLKSHHTRDYFVGGNSVGFFAVAVSVLATSQSAATFLGGPEYSYANDLSFLGFYLSALLAVWFTAHVLIPRFYAIRAVTVYELLAIRYGQNAKRYAAVMFLIGRLFASGARLYIGALAVSMILFLDIEALHVAISIALLMIGALIYAYFGGVKGVIYSDTIQAFVYITAGIAVAWYLYRSLGSDSVLIYQTLEAQGKLRVIDWSLGGDFSIYALLSGWFLLNVAAYGLDQDITQRALTCKDADSAKRSLWLSIVLTIPVALLFLIIGLLLYLYYHSDLGKAMGEFAREFQGERVTVFLYYVLHEMPQGLRGLVTVGAVAAALSSSNSVLSAMASVAIEDLYRPWREKRGGCDEAHYLRMGKRSVVWFALALSAMAMLSYVWQKSLQIPLLSFALGVMSFAYAGLLGVYGVAIFTRKGSQKGVLYALIAGFVSVVMMQPYVIGSHLGITIPFAWQLVIGSMISAGVMLLLSEDTSAQAHR